MKQFAELCSAGREDPLCACLAREVPPLVSFADYKAFRAFSQFEPGAKLDDGVLKKMAHAATLCASRAQ